VREAAAPTATRTLTGPTALVVAALLGCAFGLHRIVDPDLFLHVVVGKAILAHPSALGVSTFLDAYPHWAYVEDKWLACVGVALLSLAGGEHGLMAYQILLCVAAACAWYGMQRAWGASAGVAVAGVALALLACAFRLEPRPDTASHALLAMMLALTVADVPWRRLRWLVPLVMALWANVHGYFINGLVVLGAGAACTLLGDRTETRLGHAPRTPSERLVLLALGIGACFLQPQGWRGVLYPLWQLANLGSDPTLHGAIEEFTPSTTLLAGMDPGRTMLLASVALTAVLLPMLQRRAARAPRGARARPTVPDAVLRQEVAVAAALPWLVAPPPGLQAVPYRVTFALLVMAVIELPTLLVQRRFLAPLILVGFSALAAPLVRNVALLPPAALLLLAPAWTECGAWVRERLGAWRGRVVAAAALVVIALPVVWLRLSDRMNAGMVRAPVRTGWGIDDERFPAGAADFVAREHLPGPLLNNFDVGGYLLYRLYPEHRVFIAGSTSMYPASFLATYRTSVLGDPRPDALRATWGIETVVIDLASPATATLIERLTGAPDWALVFLDAAGAVFVHVDDGTRTLTSRRVDLGARLHELAATEHASPALPAALGGARLVFPRFNRGMFAFAAGRPDLTLREARRLWDIAPNEDLAVDEGEAARRADLLAEDLPRLEAALTAYPASRDLRMLTTLALAFHADERLRAGAPREAATDARRMIALDPAPCGPYLVLAKAAALEGELGDAHRSLDDARQRDGDGTCARSIHGDPVLAPLVGGSSP
jgi:hypothetical protein